MLTKLLVVAAMSVAMLASASAKTLGNECVVADPTGTPLNVHSQPNGSILGALYNGTGVFATDMTKDGKWVKITPFGKGKAGWVFFNFLDCN